MRYATILFAVLLSSCGQAETSSKNVTTEETSFSATIPGDPSAGLDTVLEHIDKGDGLIVDVLQAGTGRAVQMGDTVTLDYTISYVPSDTAKSDAKADKIPKDAKDSKSAPKHDAKKPARKHAGAKTDEPAAGAATDDHHKESSETSDSKEGATKDGDKDDAAKVDSAKKDTSKSNTTKSSADKTGGKEGGDEAKKESEHKDADKKGEVTKDAEKPAPDKSESGKSEADKSETTKADGDKPEADAKTDEKATGGDHDTTKPAPTPVEGEHHDTAKTGQESAKAEDKSADTKPADAPKQVIVASTKSMLMPFTVKLSNNAKPKLMPGLVRGLEGLKVGTHARITVPAALAYGKDGDTSSGIPAETPVQIDVVVVEARE